jgi:hypothetical protein
MVCVCGSMIRQIADLSRLEQSEAGEQTDNFLYA